MVLVIMVSCTQNKQETRIILDKEHSIIIGLSTPHNLSFEVVNRTAYNFRGDYDNFDFIHTYGVDKERVISIVSTINSAYFKGINDLEVIHGKFRLNNEADCYYYSDNAKIRCRIDFESDEWLKRKILHELKHHYCLTKERESFSYCIKENAGMTDGFNNTKLWDYCYHDEGCFLDTPIDKEYGFIR